MITKEELQELLQSTETFRVERTTSTNDMDKFQEAICAFSNDLPNSRKNGYLIDVTNSVVKDAVNTDLSQVVLSSIPSLSQAVTSLSQVLSQVCHKLEKKYYASAIKVLAGVVKEPQTLKFLMQLTGETNRGRFKNNVIQHLIEADLIEPTVVDNPNSSKQRYALTEKGKELLKPYEI